MSRVFVVFTFFVFVVALTLAQTAAAQSTTWTGGGATNNWSDNANWTSNAPQNGWSVYFSSVGGISDMNISGLNLGMLNMSGFSGQLRLYYPLTVSGPATLTGNVQMQDRHLTANVITIQGSLNTGTGNLTSNGDLNIYGSVWGSGSLMVSGNVYSGSSGSITGGFYVFTLGGNVDFSGLSSVDLSGGTIDMSLGGSVLVPGGAVLGNVSMPGIGMLSTSSGSATVMGYLGVGGSTDISQGSFDFYGPVTVGSGATLSNTYGSGKTYGFFDDLTIDSGTFQITAAGCELSFGAGDTVDVDGTGTFEIAGAEGNEIVLRQDGTAGGSQWTIDYEPTTTVSIDYASIQDGIASPTLQVLDCTNLGNNTGFLFPSEIEVRPFELDFGAIGVSTTAAETLTVYNTGEDTLHVTDVSAVTSYFLPGIKVFAVAPGDSQYVEVEFTPMGVGAFLDTLTFTSDDPADSTLTVPMQGTGSAADLIITVFNSTAEIVRGYDPVSATIQVSNSGDEPTGVFRVSLRVSADTVITTGDELVATGYISNIAAGFDTTINISAVLPKAAPRGDVYLGAIADDLDQVTEYDEENNTAFNSFTYQVPVIYAVRDVPSDQGGQIYLSWFASPLDLPASGGQITEYTIWRAISPTAAVQALMESEVVLLVRPGEPIPKSAAGVIRMEKIAGQTYFWHPIDTAVAYHLESYGYPEPTLFDSTGTSWEYHYFQVIAHTSDDLVFYISAPDSGYSVDNLPPCPPQNVAAEQTEPEGLQITWDPNSEADLSHYAIYRGTEVGFTPDPENLIGEPADPGLLDGDWRWNSGYYYKIAAVDIHDNSSLFATIGPDLVIGVEQSGPPKVNYLAQNRPNPFGLVTRITFGLARGADVSIRVYDVKGRLVRTLVDENRRADHYTIDWDGRDDRGNVVAGGVYFCRVISGSFVQTKKITLIR